MTATYVQNPHPISSASQEAGSRPGATSFDSRPSKTALWTGRILSGLAVLFSRPLVA